MSCRKGRHGQQKGNSAARMRRETELHMASPKDRIRRAFYVGPGQGGKYSTSYLRKLRALRGVGPVRLLKPFRTVVRYAYGDRDRG